MRIGIIGAGAIGCVVGGLLTKAGHDVTLIDLAVVDKTQAGFTLMKLHPGWVLAYEDSVSAIFGREGFPKVARIRDAIPPALPDNGGGLCFPR